MRNSINEKRVTYQVNNVLNQIIYRRKRLGLSQTDIAKKLDITLSGYFKIEKGKTKLEFRRMLEISEILDVKVEYFFKEKRF